MFTTKKIIISLAIAGAAIVSSVSAQDYTRIWSSPGSSGMVVDENDRAIVNVSGAYVKIRSSSAQSMTLRYKIDPFLDDLDANMLLYIRRSVPNGGRLSLRIREYDLFYGGTTTKWSYDSGNFVTNGYVTSADRVQNLTPSVDYPLLNDWVFDFDNKTYFLEVTIRKSSGWSTPAVASLMLSDY